MVPSEEFLKRYLESRGISGDAKVREVLARSERSGDSSLGSLLAEEKVLEETALVSLLEAYAGEREESRDRAAAENSRYGGRLAEKGLSGPSDIWNALKEQEEGRAKGTEKSLNWYLGRRGKLSPDMALGILTELDRKAVVCPDCKRTELFPAAEAPGRKTCPECGGLMIQAKKPRDLAVERPSAKDPFLGKEIGGCIVEDLLGKGGMGSVYKARHVALNKPVAVKFLSTTLGSDDTRKRFLREARSAARLEHPNIVQVYDTGTYGEFSYIVMQFVEGESAGSLVKREGPLPVDKALEIALGAAQGLGAAHEVNLVHRDVKPDNIMIDRKGYVKIADFGLAKDLEGEASALTAGGQGMGTPHYMSPEQASDARSAGPPADIYSLGTTLFTLLTGRMPFQGSSPWAVVTAVLRDPIPDVHTFRPEVPEGLALCIGKMMEKKPADRQASMAVVVEELRALAREVHSSLPPVARDADVSPRTLDDFQTPSAPWQAGGETLDEAVPGKAAAPSLQPTRTDPALEATAPTVSKERGGSSWLVPAAVGGVLVAAGVVLVLLFLPSMLHSGGEGERATSPAGGEYSGGKSGESSRTGTGSIPDGRVGGNEDEEEDPESAAVRQNPSSGKDDHAGSAGTEGEDERKSEREADAALRETRARAETFFSMGEYAKALSEYATFPEEFRPTGSWTQSWEEKKALLDRALDRIGRGIEELNVAGRDIHETAKAAAALAGELGRMSDAWGGDPPAPLTKARKEVDRRRRSLEAAADAMEKLDAIETGLEDLEPEGAEGVRNRLVGYATHENELVSRRAKAMISKLEEGMKARASSRERKDFAGAEARADRYLLEGHAEAAAGVIEPFLDSILAGVREAAAKRFRDAKALAQEKSYFEKDLAEATALFSRDSFDALDRAEKLISSHEDTEWEWLRSRAKEAVAEVLANRQLIKNRWMRKGFRIIDGFEGDLGSADVLDCNPPHRAALARFAVGLTEVTRAQYAAFQAATGHDVPPLGEGRGDEPVARVSAVDAEAYCRWLSETLGTKARLPTEDEWEVAARFAPEGMRTYPWGSEFEETKANLHGDKAVPVGSSPGDKSPCGVANMAGNLTEWCAVDGSPGSYAWRGGCFADRGRERAARCAFRQEALPEMKSSRVGFRVVVEPP